MFTWNDLKGETNLLSTIKSNNKIREEVEELKKL